MPIRLIGLAVVLAVSLLAAPVAGEAQQAGKVYRVGYLTAGSVTANPGVLEAFRQGLRDHGWVKGQNIFIEYRSAEGRFERLPEHTPWHATQRAAWEALKTAEAT